MTISNTAYPPVYSAGTQVASGYAEEIASVYLKKGYYYLIATSNLSWYLDSKSSFQALNGSLGMTNPLSASGGAFYVPIDDTVKFTAGGTQISPSTMILYPNSIGFSVPYVFDGTNYQTALQSSQSTGINDPAVLGRIYYSTDLITWNDKTNGSGLRVSTTNSSFNVFVYDGNVTEKYVWCAATTTAAGAVWTSTDSVTWTSRTLTGTVDSPGGVCINSNATNKYVLYNRSSSANPMLYSTDAITWTNVTYTAPAAPTGGCATNGTASTNQIYVYGIASTTTPVITSTDGVTWTARSINVAAGAGQVIWYDNKYWAFSLGDGNNFSTSTNGVTWTYTEAPFIIAGSPTTTKNRPFVENGRLFVRSTFSWSSTTNGTTWENTAFPLINGASSASELVYKNGKYLGLNSVAGTVLFSQPFAYIIYQVDTDPAIS